jgi:cysteine desulfurase
MHANNETGAIQPIEEIGRLVAQARGRGLKHLYFHTDAVQSAGKTPIDVKRLGVDLLSLSGHKFHGPKGIGALYLRKGVRISKLIYGGHHERDRRAGTENVPAIVGLGRAAEMARNGLLEQISRIAHLKQRLERGASERLPGVIVNGSIEHRLPNISNLSFSGVDGESLLIALDLKGIAVSTGSACASGSLEPSHVLKAMGLARERIRGSLRFSLSRYNTPEEIDYALDALEETVSRLRSMSPEGETEDQDATLQAESSF